MIEARYQADVDRLTPRERVARGMAMFDWARQWIGRQVIAEHGEMTEERLRWEVALRLYGREPGPRRLIEGLLARMGEDVSR